MWVKFEVLSQAVFMEKARKIFHGYDKEERG